jgi:hypothetical protein
MGKFLHRAPMGQPEPGFVPRNTLRLPTCRPARRKSSDLYKLPSLHFPLRGEALLQVERGQGGYDPKIAESMLPSIGSCRLRTESPGRLKGSKPKTAGLTFYRARTGESQPGATCSVSPMHLVVVSGLRVRAGAEASGQV